MKSGKCSKTMILLLGICSTQLQAWEVNDSLKNLPDTTLWNIGARHSLPGTAACSNGILAYSGMAYNPHRHTLLAFGGGHATNCFPNDLVEFNFDSLSWHPVTERDPCSANTAANSLLNSDGIALGGLKIGERIAPISRHTYDGLVVMPDTDQFYVMQSREFRATCTPDIEAFSPGTGLFWYDFQAQRWFVRDEIGLSLMYAFSAQNPAEPQWVYHGQGNDPYTFRKTNVQTGQVTLLARSPIMSVDMSMEYCPLDSCFYLFPKDSNVYRYSIANNRWTGLNPSGPTPNTHGRNVVWDTLNHVFVCHYLNAFYYYSPGLNTWYQFAPGPATGFGHHHIYDPVNNVHILVSANWSTWAYKFSETPGRFPGTGLNYAMSSERSARTITSKLVLNASPNPFNPRTTLTFHSELNLSASLTIFNASGEKIRTLKIDRNRREAVWDGTDAFGRTLGSGIYCARLETGKGVQQIRLVLIR